MAYSPPPAGLETTVRYVLQQVADGRVTWTSHKPFRYWLDGTTSIRLSVAWLVRQRYARRRNDGTTTVTDAGRAWLDN